MSLMFLEIIDVGNFQVQISFGTVYGFISLIVLSIFLYGGIRVVKILEKQEQSRLAPIMRAILYCCLFDLLWTILQFYTLTDSFLYAFGYYSYWCLVVTLMTKRI